MPSAARASLVPRAALAVALGALLAIVQHPAAAQPPAQPESATGFAAREAARATRFMAATANPHATDAAVDVLERGGSAIDAAIAAQMVLGLVEPQSSGIGGGGFLLHFDARARKVVAWDGRETAPAAADEALFLGPDGKPLRFHDAVVGGRSVGVPGLVRMLEAAHRAHGRLEWSELFRPAIALARAGFPVSPRLHALLERDPFLRRDPVAAAYFYDPSGRPWPVGHLLRNPELADTLEAIARRGSLALHAGPIAADVLEKVRGHATNPGRMDARDLAFYRPEAREPVCVTRRAHRICGMPPPSSGGIAVAQILGILDALPPARLARPDGALVVEGVHRFAEAGRLAFADRNRYVADPAFVALPGQPAPGDARRPAGALLDPDYLASRARLIGERSMGRAEAGRPAPGPAAGPSLSLERPSTTHLSIVDAQGNAVALTSSVEDAFGARLMVRGFLLNNQLTDFSFAAVEGGAPVANRVEPGKRPRSSMTPTLVLDREASRVVLAIGSPGGASIINYVARALVGVLDDGLDVQTAISLPNFGSRNGPTELEKDRVPDSLAQALRERGHELRVADMTSGLQGIMRVCEAGAPRRCALVGGADPRREGSARGR